jgi:hypothetical protein
MDNWKHSADVADRRNHDEAAFRQSGMEKPQRTYKFDPTKPFVKRKT